MSPPMVCVKIRTLSESCDTLQEFNHAELSGTYIMPSRLISAILLTIPLVQFSSS